MITIEPVMNGFIMKTWEHENPLASTQVFECREFDEFAELRAAQSMLYEVLMVLGLYGSKHDPKRLRIVIEDNEDTGGTATPVGPSL